jgi:hypothetical protein
MRMFLFLAALGFLLMIVNSLLVAYLFRMGDKAEVNEARAPRAVAPGFFLNGMPEKSVPVEALLLQIERHVQLERAAAESFVAFPTAESLHGRTVSPLVH